MICFKKMDKLIEFAKKQLKTRPELKAGDNVKVYQKIKEGEKERIQIFEGTVIAIKNGKGINATFTVRKISGGIGVEKTFPIHSPVIDKIEITKRTKTRRSKLYFLKKKIGKIKLKEIEKSIKQIEGAEEITGSKNENLEENPEEKSEEK